LKEGRRLVLVPREMPLSRIHLRNMKDAADNGCVIIPPMLSFYNGADTLQKQINHITGKILMQFGIEYDRFTVWKGQD
jgi:4-hydroxy-3-polyprenylbenzoate decarboxylase